MIDLESFNVFLANEVKTFAEDLGNYSHGTDDFQKPASTNQSDDVAGQSMKGGFLWFYSCCDIRYLYKILICFFMITLCLLIHRWPSSRIPNFCHRRSFYSCNWRCNCWVFQLVRLVQLLNCQPRLLCAYFSKSSEKKADCCILCKCRFVPKRVIKNTSHNSSQSCRRVSAKCGQICPSCWRWCKFIYWSNFEV